MFKYNITKINELTDSQLFVVLKEAGRIGNAPRNKRDNTVDYFKNDFIDLGYQNTEIELFRNLFQLAYENNLELATLDSYTLCMIIAFLGDALKLDNKNKFRLRASMFEEEDVLVIAASAIGKRASALLEKKNISNKSSESFTHKLK